MVRRIAHQVEQRIAQALDDGLVQLDVVAFQLEIDLLAQGAGQIPDHAGKFIYDAFTVCIRVSMIVSWSSEVTNRCVASAMIQNQDVTINGDGETSRDFCYIKNAIQANILAATTENADAKNQVYNVAVGDRTTLNDLFKAIREELNENNVVYNKDALYKDFRAGDVRHSQADVSKINKNLSYDGQYNVLQGIKEAMPWYVTFNNKVS